MKDLVIVGAGGHGREMLEVVHAINEAEKRWNLLGFVDDGRIPQEVCGQPVLGTCQWLSGRDCHVIVAIGAPLVRRVAVERLRALGVVRFASLVHPTARIGRSVTLGAGAMIAPFVALTASISVGEHVIVNTAAVVSHDCRLADFATLAPSSCLCGAVAVDEGGDVGAGAVVIPGKRIGAWARVGAGGVVTADVPANLTVAGVPARAVGPLTAEPENKNE